MSRRSALIHAFLVCTMSPCNVPAVCGARTHLFLDDQIVLKRAGLKRVWLPATKFARKPLVGRDHPWEAKLAYTYGTVMRDEGQLKLWYLGVDAKSRFHVCYATSEDGLAWTKPRLGLVGYGGSTQNNIVFASACIPSVLKDPAAKDPKRRYRMLYWNLGRPGQGHGACLAFSPDGIHWTDYRRNPVWPGSAGGTTPGGPGDVLNCFFDPLTGKYIAYAKARRAEVHGRHRIIARGESKDMTKWSAPEVVLVPDGHDTPTTHFYGLAAFEHGGLYLGLLWVYEAADGRIWPELVYSRDSRQWHRPSRQPFIALGKKGEFDSGMILTCAHPVVLDDEIRIYYGGFSGGHEAANRPAAIGMARLRRDGFAALAAEGRKGTLVTRPVEVTGDALLLNAKVAASGFLRVELLDADSQPIKGFSGASRATMAGDHTALRATFGGTASLRQLKGQHVRLKIEMTRARIFAFRFE